MAASPATRRSRPPPQASDRADAAAAEEEAAAQPHESFPPRGGIIPLMGSDPLLARDPLADVETHRLDDRFIPLLPADLVEALANEAHRFNARPEEIRALAAAIDHVIVQEAIAFERHIEALYVNYSPDRETIPNACSLAARNEAAYADLFARLDYLLDKANYSRLDDPRLSEVVRAANSAGLRVRVRPELIEHVALYVRGRGKVRRCTRTWRTPIRGRQHEVEVYQRLVVVARLKGDSHVILKLFREIPLRDIEALLPHAEVEMSAIDRLRVLISGAGLVGSLVLKGLKLLAFLAFWSKLLWLVPMACIVLAGRAFIGYRSARSVRDSRRTQHLYYQNVANNKAVIHTLVSMVRQEHVKEAILAWAMCRAQTAEPAEPPDGNLHERLKLDVEAWLRQRFQVEVSFDVLDAVDVLTRLGVLIDPVRGTVLDAPAAIDRLDVHRRDRHTVEHHTSTLNGRLAASHDGGTNFADSTLPLTARNHPPTQATKQPADS